jgi:glucose-6-phosphate-specific signal transduction histidine kinase
VFALVRRKTLRTNGWRELLVFGVLMVLIPIIALLVDYGYSGLLFGFEIGALPN